jgi:hypothetical protein
MAVEGNRGAVLLAELKALVDSFPHQQRASVIKMMEIAFKGLQPEAGTALNSRVPKTSAAADSNDKFKTKIENWRKE